MPRDRHQPPRRRPRPADAGGDTRELTPRPSAAQPRVLIAVTPARSSPPPPSRERKGGRTAGRHQTELPNHEEPVEDVVSVIASPQLRLPSSWPGVGRSPPSHMYRLTRRAASQSSSAAGTTDTSPTRSTTSSAGARGREIASRRAGLCRSRRLSMPRARSPTPSPCPSEASDRTSGSARAESVPNCAPPGTAPLVALRSRGRTCRPFENRGDRI
jgi:hypothetical protein